MFILILMNEPIIDPLTGLIGCYFFGVELGVGSWGMATVMEDGGGSFGDWDYGPLDEAATGDEHLSIDVDEFLGLLDEDPVTVVFFFYSVRLVILTFSCGRERVVLMIIRLFTNSSRGIALLFLGISPVFPCVLIEREVCFV